MEERRGVVHSNHVRAGKRSYFFDVMATKDDDYFLCITESRRILDENGRFYFQRQKIFVYKEDFDKFVDGAGHEIHFAHSPRPSAAK